MPKTRKPGHTSLSKDSMLEAMDIATDILSEVQHKYEGDFCGAVLGHLVIQTVAVLARGTSDTETTVRRETHRMVDTGLSMAYPAAPAPN
jgi:hypothetical protein